MQNILLGVGMILIAVLLVWLGIRQRRSAYEDYRNNCKQYTAKTTMKIVHVEKGVWEHWVEQEDGGQALMRETYYKPTYEYTVDGKTYRRGGENEFSNCGGVGREVTGYYDPANPENIMRGRPIRPILAGFIFFVGAAVLLFMAMESIRGQMYWFF